MDNVINTLVRTINRLSYPFLEDLQTVNEKSLGLYVSQINEIARENFTQPGRQSPTMNYEKLYKIIAADPSAWHMYVEKHEVQGFIHVELISRTQAHELSCGLIDENSLIPLTSQSKEEKVIHIGSVVSKLFPHNVSCKIPVRLIAGAIDKVLALRDEVPSIKRIVTCDFEDKFGKRHFDYKLPRYGFKEIGKSINGDTVWELDLESSNRPFCKLIGVVSSKRLSFINKKDYFSTLKEFFSRIPNALKLANQSLDEVIKLSKKVGQLEND